jgi:UDP-N-acetyl-D-glucosamine dehydrogenase
MRNYKFNMNSVNLDAQTLGSADCVVIVTDHEITDWQSIADHATLVIDTRNAMAKIDSPSARIVKA